MNVPDFLKQMLLDEYGDDYFNKIIEGYSVNRLTTFRVNTLKANIEEIKEVLNELKIKYINIEWYKDAFILEQEYPIQDLDIYKDGKIYVQSLSSMIPALILDPKDRENILDMCAAPGRKNYPNGCFVRKQSNDYCM
ncbi:MAG: hypothetical protein J5507_00420 [Clostridia bacterium]|nr:hypothetical protein [Clostridia bacterium]